MKKLLGLFLCMLMFVGITACDDAEQKVKLDSESALMIGSLAGEKSVHPALVELSGTSWTCAINTNTITRYQHTNDGTTTEQTVVTELPIIVYAYTINFNSDNTFTATVRGTFTSNMDARYRSADVATVAFSHEHYTIDAGPAYGAYSGYSGHASPGCSTIDIQGYWQKSTYNAFPTDPYDLENLEMYELKITGYTYTRIVMTVDNGTSADDNVATVIGTGAGYHYTNAWVTPANIDTGTITLENEDADWEMFYIYNTNDGTGPSIDGKEVMMMLPAKATALPYSSNTYVNGASTGLPGSVVWTKD